MSQEYCILNLLNIEDKNIKLTENFYKIEDFDGIKYKVIEDDNSQIVYSHDNSRVFYSKERPRTEIIITRVNVNEWKS